MRADDFRRDVRTYTLRPLREAIADLSDVVPLTASDDFHFSTATLAADTALLTDSFGSRLEYNRTPQAHCPWRPRSLSSRPLHAGADAVELRAPGADDAPRRRLSGRHG